MNYSTIRVIILLIIMMSSTKVVTLAFTINNNPNHTCRNHVPSPSFSFFTPRSCSRVFMSSSSSSSSSNNNSNNVQKPQNEFSRTVRTEIILSPRNANSGRQYKKDISASDDELHKLAKRFSLSKISKLDANLSLKKDSLNSGGSSNNAASSGRGSAIGSSSGGDCIQVQGDVTAHVTQTCVRTNEDFDIELEFNIFVIVRASSSNDYYANTKGEQELGGMSLSQIEGQLGGDRGGRRKKGKKKRGGNANIINTSLNEMNMREIENMLQEYESNDDIFEDENVLGSDGLLDVGELVAQMFRLKLDPYPKKPGSEPVRYSISG